jgi:hypothetical protein
VSDGIPIKPSSQRTRTPRKTGSRPGVLRGDSACGRASAPTAYRSRLAEPESAADRLRDAIQAEARLRDILIGADPSISIAGSGVTFEVAAENWLAYIKDDRKRRPSTVSGYRRELDRNLVPEVWCGHPTRSDYDTGHRCLSRAARRRRDAEPSHDQQAARPAACDFQARAADLRSGEESGRRGRAPASPSIWGHHGARRAPG